MDEVELSRRNRHGKECVRLGLGEGKEEVEADAGARDIVYECIERIRMKCEKVGKRLYKLFRGESGIGSHCSPVHADGKKAENPNVS